MAGLAQDSRRDAGVVASVDRSCSELGPEPATQTIRSRDGLRQLASEWQALEAASTATVYQSFAWAAACASELRHDSDLMILVARERGRLVAVAPLMVERHMGIATLRWLGGSLTIYGDVLAERSFDVTNWLRHALDDMSKRKAAHCLLLENVRADARIAPFLEGAGCEVGRTTAPWINLAALGSFEAWRAGQSRNTRRGRARRLKQLEAAGEVSFCFERAGPDAASRVAELLAMKRDWAKARDVFSRTIGDRSFEATVGALVASGGGPDARFSVLMLDGKAIAIELGFVSGDTYVSYLGAYDPASEEFSPGALQLERTLEACFAEGLAVFDLQPPADLYKQSLASGEMTVKSYSAALTRFGFLGLAVAKVDPVGLAKGALNQLPARYRPLVHRVALAMRRRSTGRSARDDKFVTPAFVNRLLLILSAGAAAVAAGAMAD